MEDDDIDIADAAGVDEDAVEPSTGADGDQLRGDIEEAIAKQKVEKGDPEPYKGLKGRTDNQPGGHYEGCDEFAKEAARNGTTLKAALSDYHGIEKALRASPVNGINHICKRLGLSPQKVAQAMLQQGPPQQNYQAQQYQAQQNYQAQAAQQAEYQHHVADIEASRRSMPFFESLRPAMARIAQVRPDIRTVKQAYDAALKLNPTFGMSAEIARRDAVRDRQMGRGKRR